MRISVQSAPPGMDPLDFQALKDAGVSVFHAGYYGAYDYRQWPCYADECATLGLALDIDPGEEPMSGGTSWLDMIAPVANHPALGRVWLWDEPVWNCSNGNWPQYTLQNWLDAVDRLIQRWPDIGRTTAQAYIGNRDQIRQCSRKLTTFVYDYYSSDVGVVGYWAKWAQTVNEGLPVMSFLQGFGNLNAATLRSIAQAAIQNGASELRWWYGGSQPGPAVSSQAWRDMVQITKELTLDVNADGHVGVGDIVAAINQGQSNGQVAVIEEEILKQ